MDSSNDKKNEVFYFQQILDDVPQNLNWLSENEIAVLNQFRVTKRRNEWLLGRWTAKQAILRLFAKSQREVNVKLIEIIAADDGAPDIFINGRLSVYPLSLSHSHNRAVCLIGKNGIPLGCDIEKIEDRSMAFIRDYFTNDEMHRVLNTVESKRPSIANLIWSAKESVLKALRQGLRIDTRQIEMIDLIEHENSGVFIIEFKKNKSLYKGQFFYSDNFVFTFVMNAQNWILSELK